MNFDQIERPNSGFESQDETINLREQIEKYLRRWYWFLLGILLTGSIAFLYLRWATRIYEAETSILIKNEEGTKSLSELSAFEDLGIFSGRSNRVDNEIHILKSRSLMKGVVEDLRLNIKYFITAPFSKRTVEIYGNVPFNLSLSCDTLPEALNTRFNVNIRSDSEFSVRFEDEEVDKTGYFGQDFPMPFGSILLTPDPEHFPHPLVDEIKVVISPINSVVASYSNAVNVEGVDQFSSIIKLNLQSNVVDRAVKVLDLLVDKYNDDAINDKNLISQNTIDFIDDRLSIIQGELNKVERSVEAFKSSRQLTDLASEAQAFVGSVVENEKKILELNTQMSLIDFLEDYLENEQEDLIPSNLGLAQSGIEASIAKYNEILLQRNKLLNSSTKQSPVILNLNEVLANLRNSLMESMKNAKSSLEIQMRELQVQVDKLNEKIASVPRYERQFRNKERERKIIETLYLYLLQKREETAISLAVTTPSAKIIDRAYSSGAPISPKAKMIYLIALLAGLAIPFAILYLREMMDTKVRSRKDLTDKLNIPVLGDLPDSGTKEPVILKQADRSSVAESFRLLHTNLDFMMSQSAEKGRTVLVTSTMSKEGKTFVALNMAATLAYSGRKVALVGLDLRAPKLILQVL